MAELFTNLARSTLASGITAGALSLTVQSGDGNDLFPTLGGSDEFRAVIFKKATGDVEIIRVTARSADVFTIVRAQEDIGNITAVAFAFDAGDLIELRPTSAFFTSLAAGASSANIQHGDFLYGVDTGAPNVYTVAMTPTATTLSVGQEVRVKIGAGNTNTGIAATLQLDAIAADPITMEGGGNPPSGSIRAGFVHTFNWDGTSFIFKSAGLALTAAGHDALGKQIKNVAAGTATTDAATIGGTETLIAKTLGNPTITNPVLNGGATGSIVDTDGTFAANSDTLLASQKATLTLVTTGIVHPAFRAYVLSNYTTGIGAVITFNTETFDVTSDYNNSTYRFIPSVAGLYYIAATIAISSATSSGTLGDVLLRKNGSIIARSGEHHVINTDDANYNPSTLVQMNGTTDYVEIASSGATGIYGGTTRSWFEGFRIQP